MSGIQIEHLCSINRASIKALQDLAFSITLRCRTPGELQSNGEHEIQNTESRLFNLKRVFVYCGDFLDEGFSIENVNDPYCLY